MVSVCRLISAPVLTSGHEFSVVIKTIRLRVQAAEMRFLRKVAGLILRDWVRSSSVRGILRSLDQEEPVELIWPPVRLPVELLQARPSERNPQGKPSTRWRDHIPQLAWESLQVYRPVKALRPEQILELGCIVTEMSVRELQALNLSDLAVVAHLGSQKHWNPRKMRAALQGFLRSRKLKPEDLGVVDLVSLGHLLCGFSLSEMSRLDPFNLSVAALFLREMDLPCSEQQTEALTARLSSPLGFGPVSTWSSEIFTEIGNLAAGLDDMVLSSLVKEQMEGLAPSAITLIPPRKLAVVFSATQLSWLSSEQAWAVSDEQWEGLDSQQRQALSMAQFEGDAMLGHRGRNQARSVWFADHFTACMLFLLCALLHVL